MGAGEKSMNSSKIFRDKFKNFAEEAMMPAAQKKNFGTVKKLIMASTPAATSA